MKTMTCKELGGPCDEAMHAATADEMATVAMAHLEAAHPEMAATIKEMPKDDPKMQEWNTKFQADFAAKPEDN